MTEQSLILVIDDKPENLQVISAALQKVGFRVAVATSGERGLKLAENSPPDLILLDIMMPDMDGLETCQQLKSIPTIASIPVIFMTALTDTTHKVKGFEVGAVDYVTKPFEMVEVVARVKTHLQLYQLTHSLEAQVVERTQALATALEKLQQSQLQLIQSEKMSVLGQLMTGIAHEINNPIGSVYGNLEYLETAFQEVLAHLQRYQQAAGKDNISAHAQEIDLGYLLEDIPKTFYALQNASQRIIDITTSLRTFGRADTTAKQPFDLHEIINSTLLILQYRLKSKDDRPAIQVRQQYGQIPAVNCHPGQLNQVFMNLIANAIDALEEAHQAGHSCPEQTGAAPSDESSLERVNQITIMTDVWTDPAFVYVQIADNGLGMSPEVQARAFESLYTTKIAGKGTGLGLSISRQIIETNHSGTLKFQSTPGEGTTFTLLLPVSADLNA